MLWNRSLLGVCWLNGNKLSTQVNQDEYIQYVHESYPLPGWSAVQEGQFIVVGIGKQELEDHSSHGEIDILGPFRVVGIRPHTTKDGGA